MSAADATPLLAAVAAGHLDCARAFTEADVEDLVLDCLDDPATRPALLRLLDLRCPSCDPGDDCLRPHRDKVAGGRPTDGGQGIGRVDVPLKCEEIDEVVVWLEIKGPAAAFNCGGDWCQLGGTIRSARGSILWPAQRDNVGAVGPGCQNHDGWRPFEYATFADALVKVSDTDPAQALARCLGSITGTANGITPGRNTDSEVTPAQVYTYLISKVVRDCRRLAAAARRARPGIINPKYAWPGRYSPSGGWWSIENDQWLFYMVGATTDDKVHDEVIGEQLTSIRRFNPGRLPTSWDDPAAAALVNPTDAFVALNELAA